MIRQKKYKLLEQLLLFKIKSSFSLECFSYKPNPEVLFLTRVSSKLLEKNFARKNLIIQFKKLLLYFKVGWGIPYEGFECDENFKY